MDEDKLYSFVMRGELTKVSGNYSITLRYDYVSRPYIFKDDTLVFETNKPGYNETVYFKVEWKSEDEIFLYIESDNDKYSNEKYFIKID